MKTILQQPDVDRDTLSSQQAGNDAKTKAVAHVGEDDHGHWDEVEVFNDIERKKIGAAEFCKEAHHEEGEKYYHRCGEEDPLPEDLLLSHRLLLEDKVLPAVFVKKVEGAYGTEDFGETGE